MSCALRKPQSSLVRPLIFFSGNLLHSSLIFTHYFNSVYIVQHTRHFIEWTIAVKYKLGEKKLLPFWIFSYYKIQGYADCRDSI